MNVLQPIQFDEETIDTYRQEVGPPHTMTTEMTERQGFNSSRQN